MKRAAKNLSEGMSLSNKTFLLIFTGLLISVFLPLSVRADIALDTSANAEPIGIIEVKPALSFSGFTANNKTMLFSADKYWLEKTDHSKNYKINFLESKTKLKDGLYPVILSEAPKDELREYYIKELNFDTKIAEEIVKGLSPFAYVDVVGGRANLVSAYKNEQKPVDSIDQVDEGGNNLIVTNNFPIGIYSFLVIGKDNSDKLANWQFRVTEHSASDIMAVETGYEKLTLAAIADKDKDIDLVQTIEGGANISWRSADEGIIKIDGKKGLVNRHDFDDKEVILTATISSGSFSMNKEFKLKVIKNDLYLAINGFTANGKLIKSEDNKHFILAKEGSVENYLINFNDGYKTNLKDGQYAIRFNNLSGELQDSLKKYYSDLKYSEAEIEAIINGRQACAHINAAKGKLQLISLRRPGLIVGESLDSIADINVNKFLPLSINYNYPEGVYDTVVDLDGVDGLNKIKWQLEVIDLDLQAVKADLNSLSFNESITSDIELKILGANGSVRSWKSSKPSIIADDGKVTRPEFGNGNVNVDLTVEVTKGFARQVKTFKLTVLQKDQIITPPAIGGGGGGVAGSVTPQNINAINFPLSLINSQNGVLTQSFANGFTARLAVSPNSFTGNAVFRIAEGSEENAIGGRHFALTATDSNGNPIRKFTNNLNITFSGLPLPGNVSGLGVYYYDEALLSWILVPDAIFDQANGLVSFSVDHLTNFAIFSEQPVTQQVLGEATYADGTLLRGSDKHIFVVVGGKLQRILSLKELAQYADQEILEVEDSVIAAYAKVSAAKAVLGVRKYNFTRDLKIGMTGDDVQELQRYLNNNGYLLAKTGPGSAGQETKKFGRATREALVKFQKANKINPAVGYFGSLTRKAVNK